MEEIKQQKQINMKTIITLLLLSLCVNINAQISTGTTIENPRIISTTNPLNYELSENQNDYYVLAFRNAKYSNIKDFRTVGFKATKEELNSFYNDLVSVIGSGSDKEYTLGNHTLMVSPKKKGLYLFFYSPTETDSFFYISAKNLDKLFGK